MKKDNIIIKTLLYNGLTKSEYDEVKVHILNRNIKVLKVTSIFCFFMGFIFIFINKLTGSEIFIPYVVLLSGGVVVFLLRLLVKNKYALGLLTCYLMIGVVFAYAFLLSSNPANRAMPATSMIVFLALFPLTVDDRPVRMGSFVLTTAALYLVYSYQFKTPEAFRLDILNTTTFTIVGFIFYLVVCNRNVDEVYQNKKVEKIQRDVISSLALVIEVRDEGTKKHTERTEYYIKILTDHMKHHMKYSEISENFYEDVIAASPLHDIGKIMIPDVILNKPGKLTDEEFEVMKRHSEYGAGIIDKTMKKMENSSYYTIAHNMALFHHERYDGKGYPYGLKGEDIPIEARIMAIVDVYDALVSERVYKQAYSKEMAMQIIHEAKGTQFDSTLAQLFLDALNDD